MRLRFQVSYIWLNFAFDACSTGTKGFTVKMWMYLMDLWPVGLNSMERFFFVHTFCLSEMIYI